MIKRKAHKTLEYLASQFKAVAVTGPRQSGKTTLIRSTFKDKDYVNLENPDTRLFASEDPRGFLGMYPKGAILDEVQRVPELFSYLQQILDESDVKGKFILSGSNNFLFQEGISQSLAGRVGYLFLLPLSLAESPILSANSNDVIYKGGYPALHSEKFDINLYYSNYIRTYVERDVRLIKNISDLYAFEKLIRLCAGRVGQLLNLSNLAVEVGVDVKTINSWLSVLEAGFVLYRLQPFHKNFNKRIVKSPKLYFYDTGLASSLLGINSADQLMLHPLRGNLFENLIVTDILKLRYNKGLPPNMYFWRDNSGNEVDLILEKDGLSIPVEIKSGKTITSSYFKGINYWQKISGISEGFVVYDGDSKQIRSNGITVLPFSRTEEIDLK